MKFCNPYCILTFFSFFIFSGTAGAHPHELGKMNHGPSLESYQVQLDFTIGGSANRQHDQNITIAKKDKLQTTYSIANSSVLKKYNVDDSLISVFKFTNGVIASSEISWVLPSSIGKSDMSMEIFGRFADPIINFNSVADMETVLFSIWRTPMNTIYIRKSTEKEGFVGRTLAYNILFENETTDNQGKNEIKNSRYLNENGEVKGYYLNKIKKTLKRYLSGYA